MKKSRSAPPILAAVVAVTGCVPLEPDEPVVQTNDQDEICRMEAAIGTHVKEETCREDSVSRSTDDAGSDRDLNGIFGDITVERVNDRTPPEGTCATERD